MDGRTDDGGNGLTAAERALIERSGITEDIGAFVRRVISATSVPRESRHELLRELLTHFEDGLASGRSSEALIRAFGDAETAATLFTKSRRPKRFRRAMPRPRLAGLGRDLRLAVRTLRRNPGYALTAILTLALGIGANTAVFSVIDGVLLSPLPFDDPDRLVRIYMTDRTGNADLPWSAPNVREMEEGTGTFSALTAYRWRDATLTGIGDPRAVDALAVSGGLLATLGVTPTLGRDVTTAESQPGGAAAVLVSHRFWTERLGGDPSVLGRTLHLSGETHELVGVGPPGFDYPGGAEMWVGGRWNEADFPRGRLTLSVVGRVARGHTIQQANAEMVALASRLAEEYPSSNASLGARIVPLDDTVVGDARTGLIVLFGGVVMVLLIACVNVANLTLVRGSNRIDEFALRSSLGAGRADLVRQMLAESLVVAAAGGLLGVAMARWGVEALRLLSGGRIPRMSEVSVDATVLGFAAASALVVALLFGLAPALRLSQASISQLVRRGRGRLGSGNPDLRSVLLIAEVALSVTLLVGAGLLVRSFARIQSVELGFDPDEVVEFTVTLPSVQYSDEMTIAFFEELRERMATLPGVEAVGMGSGTPMGSSVTSRSVVIPGEEAPQEGQEPDWLVRWASPGYLDALGIPLLRGRDITAADREGSRRVVLISRVAADRFFTGDDPVGREIELPGDGSWTVVGVVGDVRSLDVVEDAQPEIYLPHAQWARRYMTAVLRTSTNEAGLEAAVRETVAGLDGALAVDDFRPLAERVARSSSTQRFYMVLLGSFAGLATLLAVVGLYGVVAYVVSGRTREVGIRLALGARPDEVVHLIARQGMQPVLIGLAVGLLGAALGARGLQSLLYEITPWDPVTFALGSSVLLAGAVLAVLLPAHRAARTAPTEAIRQE